MMRNWTSLIGVTIFLLVASISFAQSQEPPPGPPKISQKHQNKTTPKQSQSKSNDYRRNALSPVVKKIPTTSPNPEKRNDTNYTNEKPAFDWWSKPTDVLLVIFNGLLAVFTFFLWWSTHKMWKATKDTAEAARKSAEALPAIERAYVFVTIVEWFHEKDRVLTEDGTAQSVITVWLYNAGKTPAVLTTLNLDAFPMKTYPNRKDIGKPSDNTIPPGIIIRSDRAKSFTAKVRLSNKEWGKIECSEIKLVCYGRVEYEDVFGHDHATGFCWEWNPHEFHRCFYISNNKELNYYT